MSRSRSVEITEVPEQDSIIPVTIIDPYAALKHVLAQESARYLDAETSQKQRDAVLRGVAWLDEQEITWHTIVLKNGFSISNDETCVLGRLTSLGFNETAKMFNLSLDECAHLGFYGDIVRGHEKFLTQLWSAAARYKNSAS